MGPRLKKSIELCLIGGATVLAVALSSGAQAAFVAYSGSGSDTTFVGLASDSIDLGFVSSNYTLQASLGLSVSSQFGSSVSPEGHANLQVVQGCLSAASSCSGAWFDIPMTGLGTAFSAAPLTDVKQYDTTPLHLTTPAARSFRALFSADFDPKSTVGVSGTLQVVAVPEPTVWLMTLGGIGLVGWMRLRKSESFS